MQGGSDRDDRGGDELPWESESHCRVLSQEGSGEGGGVILRYTVNYSTTFATPFLRKNSTMRFAFPRQFVTAAVISVTSALHTTNPTK
jgi:hypothetical protein